MRSLIKTMVCLDLREIDCFKKRHSTETLGCQILLQKNAILFSLQPVQPTKPTKLSPSPINILSALSDRTVCIGSEQLPFPFPHHPDQQIPYINVLNSFIR